MYFDPVFMLMLKKPGIKRQSTPKMAKTLGSFCMGIHPECVPIMSSESTAACPKHLLFTKICDSWMYMIINLHATRKKKYLTHPKANF